MCLSFNSGWLELFLKFGFLTRVLCLLVLLMVSVVVIMSLLVYLLPVIPINLLFDGCVWFDV